MFAGQVIEGVAAPLTVMVNVHCDLLFDASVAVQVTVVWPPGKELPEAGRQATLAVPQVSVAVGVV